MNSNTENSNNDSGEEKKSQIELENTIDNLQKEVKRLEKLAEVFRDTINRLEKENKELSERCEILEAKKVSHPNIEDNVVKLQKTIAKLEIENKDLRVKLDSLKEIKVVSEEPVEPVKQIIRASHAAIEEKGENEKGETRGVKHIPEIKSGKVADLVKRRQIAIEGQEQAKFSLKLIEGTKIEHEKETVVQPKPTPPSQKSPPVSEEPKIKVIESPDGRRKCPTCRNQNLRLIREVIDKTKLISAYPRMYGKKFKCGQCGAEWR